MMDMTGYLGKKADVITKDGVFTGYVFDVLDSDDSDIGKDSIDIALLDREAVVEIALEDIIRVDIDESYPIYDFHNS